MGGCEIFPVWKLLNRKAEDSTLKWDRLPDVLDGSAAFLTMSQCPAAKELKKLCSLIDQRRLLQHHTHQWQKSLPSEAVEAFAEEDSTLVLEWNATTDHAITTTRHSSRSPRTIRHSKRSSNLVTHR